MGGKRLVCDRQRRQCKYRSSCTGSPVYLPAVLTNSAQTTNPGHPIPRCCLQSDARAPAFFRSQQPRYHARLHPLLFFQHPPSTISYDLYHRASHFLVSQCSKATRFASIPRDRLLTAHTASLRPVHHHQHHSSTGFYSSVYGRRKTLGAWLLRDTGDCFMRCG